LVSQVLSQPLIFMECRKVLDEQIAPIHYADLTKLAIHRLGYSEDEINMFKQKEDVRQWLPGKYDVGYIKHPHYVMYLKSWVSYAVQYSLLNSQNPYIIPANLNDSWKACEELLLRYPYLQNKFNKEPEQLAHDRAKGYLIEFHVTGWFKSKWPEFVQEPKNFRLWSEPCSHDFKLALPGITRLVDVMGPNHDGEWSLVKGKNPTDIHLIADIDTNKNAVVIEGYKGGEDFNGHISKYNTKPIQWMIFYLNALSNDIPYQVFFDNKHN